MIIRKRILQLLLLFSPVVWSQTPVIQINPGQVSIEPGQLATFHVSVVNNGGFNQQLFFSISNTDLPSSTYTSNFSVQPVSYPYTSGTDLTIQTNGSLQIGHYTISVTGSNGPVSTSATCYLDIVAPQCEWTSTPFPNGTPLGYFLTIDSTGNKWLPGGSGLLKYNGVNWTIYNSTNSNYPSNASLMSKISVDGQNSLWMASEQIGLIKYDGVFWTNYNTTSSSIPTDSLTWIVIDSTQNKWIASSNSGLIKFDGVNWTTFKTSNSPILSNCIKRLALDRLGNIWGAGYSSPSSYSASFIFKFDGNNWTFYTSANSCFSFSCIMSGLEFDQFNNLWFSAGFPQACGGISTGLIKFNGNQWEVWQDSTTAPYNHYIKNTLCSIVQQDNQSKLPVSYIRDIYIDKQNIIWIANLGNLAGLGSGITRFNGSSWTTYNKSNSNLPQDAVRGINYSNDTLWVTAAVDHYNQYLNQNSLASLHCTNPNLPVSIETHLDIPNKNVYVFPNPVVTKAIIKSNIVTGGTFELFDIYGRRTRIINIVENKFEIDLSDLESGVYYFVVSEGSVSIDRGKIIKN